LSQFASIKRPFIFLIVPIIFAGVVTLGLTLIAPGVSLFSLGYPMLFSVLVVFFMSIPYALKPLFFTTEKLYLKMGYANVIFEHQLIKKLLFVLVPLMVIDIMFNEGILFRSVLIDKYPFLSVYLLILDVVAIGALVRIMTQIGKKDFRFYFAKGCCKIISEKEDSLEKLRYLRLLLGSYDKYLRRMIKVGIDEKKIYSIILYKNVEERSKIINSICDSLEGDKLGLAKYLSSIHKVPDSEFYIQETFLQQLKPIGVILATAIPIIISIISILMGMK
jgi:hypothetical protein